PVDAPQLFAEISIVVLERCHGGLGRVGKRGQGARWSERSTVAGVGGGVGHIAVGTVARRQAPGISSVSFEMFRIGDAIGSIDERKIAVVYKVRGGKPVLQTMRIEPEERIVSEEQRASRADTHVELDAVIGVPVAVVIPVRGP